MIKPDQHSDNSKSVKDVYTKQSKKYQNPNKKNKKIIAAGQTSMISKKELEIIARNYDYYEQKENKSKTVLLLSIFTILILILLSIILLMIFESNNSYIKSIDILPNNSLKIEVNLKNKIIEKINFCSFNNSHDEDMDWIETLDDKCVYEGNKSIKYIYLKDNEGKVLGPYEISNYANAVISFSSKIENLYLAVGDTRSISYNIESIGNVNILWKDYDGNIIDIVDDKIVAKKPGKTIVTGIALDKEISIDVLVTDLIVKLPEHFNYDKEYLPCNIYNEEQADLLDKILESRIEESGGYGTRAATVAAARFLSLELPYRIDYFFENGRVSGEGVNYADGEGRYYHRGLYLNKNKFSDLQYVFAGPSIWGCPLTNYEDAGKYVRGEKMSNGLDCSGFVSWALINGGYDIGDRGAGDTPAPGEMTDLGKMTTVTKDLIDSNKVKAGDLINWWGHIGIIIGISDTTYYVAESLNTYEGLVVKEYTKEEMPDSWTYIMLMDTVYKTDGNYTTMWY